MGRKPTTSLLTDEQLLEHKKTYFQEYYKRNKTSFTKPSVITNAISRLIADDNYLIQLINEVTIEKLLSLSQQNPIVK